MAIRLDENPFDLVKASDFSAAEILDYWVDIADEHGGLVNFLQPRLLMPMILVGGKGSGKTHLMRYCSAPVQAARAGSITNAVVKDGYLGIYVRAEGLNSQKFSGKKQTEDLWLAIFSMYFELWLVATFLDVLKSWLKENEECDYDSSGLVSDIHELFDTDVKGEFATIDELIEYVTRLRKHIDYAANNVAITGTMDPVVISFSPGTLFYGLPRIVAQRIREFEKTVFVYLIDEAENFTASQQRFLNSLIRYRSGNATVKVGARLYGIRTYETLGSGEPIKRGSEYARVELDSFLRDESSAYEVFVEKLVAKRLDQVGLTSRRNGELRDCFQELNKTNFYQKPTLEAVSGRDRKGADRVHMAKLRSNLTKGFDAPPSWVEQIVTLLTMKDYPLLEKVNILLLYRAWADTTGEIRAAAESISAKAKAFLNNGKVAAPDYEDVLSHFGSDLLAQLYRECGKTIPYCGWEQLVHLSQGIPRNLLGILKQIYRRSSFAGEKPFADGVISVESQSLGVLDSAAWFWEDAQPTGTGVDVREGVEALAVLFRTVRYSDKPSECDIGTFSVDEEKLTENARKVLQTCENWSYLIKIQAGNKNKNSHAVDAKYQLGPMLAPRWGVSIHRRGTIELQQELANSILDHTKRATLASLMRGRVQNMFIEVSRNATVKQPKLL
ncbi:ORC-CDC6 family AAA ATPase (plasmid) [Rhizobium leguminosarum]